MNGHTAKALRRKVYGDHAQRGARRYQRQVSWYPASGGKIITHTWARVATGLRRAYQDAKKRGGV